MSTSSRSSRPATPDSRTVETRAVETRTVETRGTPVVPEPRSPRPVRRPPAPSGRSTTVTHLVRAYDEEVVPLASVQGTLALDLGLRAAAAPRGPELRLVEEEPANPARRQAEVRAWAGRFAQAVVEVLGGDRPLTQLLRCTSPRVYQDLTRRVQILARTTATPQRRRTLRPQVRSVHVFQPTPESAEVSVHVGHGRRSRALAARLDHRDGRWTCTDLLVG